MTLKLQNLVVFPPEGTDTFWTVQWEFVPNVYKSQVQKVHSTYWRMPKASQDITPKVTRGF